MGGTKEGSEKGRMEGGKEKRRADSSSEEMKKEMRRAKEDSRGTCRDISKE